MSACLRWAGRLGEGGRSDRQPGHPRIAQVQTSSRAYTEQPARHLPCRAERSHSEDCPSLESERGAGPYSKVYKNKATWEATFGTVPDESFQTGSSVADGRSRPPWEAVSQLNERNLVWSTDLQAKLLKSVVAKDLELSEEEIEKALTDLENLMPDMAGKLPTMKANIVKELVRDTGAVAQRLLRLKTIFPEGNVSQLGSRCPALMLSGEEGLGELQEKADRLRRELPGVDIDRLVTAHPNEVLRVDNFLEAIEEAKRLMPTLDIADMLATNPARVFSFERGSNLIPGDLKRP